MTAPYHGCQHSAQDWYRDRTGALRCSECEAGSPVVGALLVAAASLAGLVVGFVLAVLLEAAGWLP